MTQRMPSQVVWVYGDQHSCPDFGTDGVVSATEQKSGQKYDSGNMSAQMSGAFPHAAHAALLERGAVVPGYDPHQVQRAFPARWQGYIRANFRNLGHVQQVFGVSERAARKWWNGEGGVNGSYVAIAKKEHPIQAEQMLFAAE
jgi:hypothetical protein